jgi:hypothetical protein
MAARVWRAVPACAGFPTNEDGDIAVFQIGRRYPGTLLRPWRAAT